MDKKVVLNNLKPLWYLIKGRIRYPFLKRRLGENNPNVYFGLTDHPLDVDGSAFFSLFTMLRKINRKKASCVLQVKFREQKSNSFIFIARGFDVYKIRDFDFEFAHNYKITDKTPFKDLLLQIDILRNDSYRLRLTGEKSVPENRTPMIADDIQDDRLKVEFNELEEFYTLTTEKITLELYKKNFCIKVYDKAGNLITETGGKSDILTAINYRASLYKETGSCFTEPTCLFLKEKTAVDFSTGFNSGMSCPIFIIFLAAFMSLS